MAAYDTPEVRESTGRQARRRVPRSSHGEWVPAPDRPHPVDLLAAQEATRLAELVPLRHERMATSPFAFYRGAAVILASDLASQPHSGLGVQLCGDAHLANFGSFASPERQLVFDINDFDETLPGPFEWDLKRLAASFEIAGRDIGLSAKSRAAAIAAGVVYYCAAMQHFAAMGHLDVWYARLTVDEIGARWGADASAQMRKQFERALQKAASKDRLRALSKLTTLEGGELRFVSSPPVVQRMDELVGPEQHAELIARIEHAFAAYRLTLPSDRRVLLDRYRFVDLARKVVGVGSVGTRCWVALMLGRDGQDPLFLQVKEAEPSVLEAHLGPSVYAQHGERVVRGQRLTQATSDVMLGWAKVDGDDGRPHHYYFRQLWDQKGGANIEAFTPAGMAIYAEMCGYALARAHARSGDACELSGYVGGGSSLARAMTNFAVAYADQNEADHRRFVEHLAEA